MPLDARVLPLKANSVPNGQRLSAFLVGVSYGRIIVDNIFYIIPKHGAGAYRPSNQDVNVRLSAFRGWSASSEQIALLHSAASQPKIIACPVTLSSWEPEDISISAQIVRSKHSVTGFKYAGNANVEATKRQVDGRIRGRQGGVNIELSHCSWRGGKCSAPGRMRSILRTLSRLTPECSARISESKISAVRPQLTHPAAYGSSSRFYALASTPLDARNVRLQPSS